MKVFKELPKSVYYTLSLRAASAKKLIKNKEVVPVLVSLTSIPERLSNLDLVIKSILNQTKLPKKITLWLHKDLKNKLPERLSSLQSVYFEIKYSNLTSSHRKLIHSLAQYPNETIITCDDDLIYGKDLIEKLYSEHLKYPKDIIGNETTQIKLDKNNNYLPFSAWKKKSVKYKINRLLPIGAWGILYPKNSMPKEIFDVDLFLKLTPEADDLWFKGMALINNVISRESNNKPKKPIPIIGTQKVALKKENVKGKKNEIQWNALSKHFNLKEILLSK